MHDEAFANAFMPRRARVLQIPLRHYSLAHEIWLISRNNPILSRGGNIRREDIIQAVLICAHTHAQLLKLDTDIFLGWKIRIWRRRLRAEDFALALAAFEEYRAAGSTEPPTLEVAGEKGHPPGAPFVLQLLQFLMQRMHLSETAALDYPFGLAKWHYCAHWESEQSLRIKNASDFSCERIFRRSDELVAGGMDINQAFRIAREEEEGNPS